MKYALNAWCEKKYLAQADEIIVPYKEKGRTLDYPELYPEAAVSIQCYGYKAQEIDWEELQRISKMFPKGFSVGVMDIDSIRAARLCKLPVYMLKYINNFAELNQLKREGVCCVYVDQPLFSSCNKLKEFNIPIRWTPTVVDSSIGFLENLLHGTWIRPEDIDQYDIIPECIVEFPESNGSRAEQAFFRVYHDYKKWDQDLGYLLREFKDKDYANYLIDPELVRHRQNCHQRCEEKPYGQGCHICDNVFNIANHDKVQAYFDQIQGAQSQN